MAFSWAVISATANIGREPELRYTPGGDGVCSFSACVNSPGKADASGQRTENPTWYRLSIWGKGGETFAEIAQKGMSVSFSGDLQQRTYNDKEGVERTSLEVNVRNWSLPNIAFGTGDAAPEEEEEAAPAPARAAAPAARANAARPAPARRAASRELDDVPF